MTTKNPYLDAKREWNERYGTFIQSTKTWRLIAILSLCSTVIAVIGLVIMGTQNKLIPYIVEVHKLGHVVPVQTAERIQAADHRVIKSLLARFIVDFRSVILDSTAQKQSILNVYSFLGQSYPATSKISEFYTKGHNPFERAKSEIVSVDISSILPISDQSWRIEWVEIIRDRRGIEQERKNMQAMASIEIVAPKNVEQIYKNPIGLYITDLNWTKQL